MERTGKTDVVVVGAGPGGSTAAAFLSRAGLRTVLVDKARFPRDKACGDAVCGQSVEVLRELGLEPLPLEKGFRRIYGEDFYSVRGDALHLPMGRDAGGSIGRVTPYVIARARFDDMLFQHIKTLPHVSTLEEFTFTDVIRENSRITGIVGTDADGTTQRIEARLVIGADGALSRVAQAVGAYDFRHRSLEHWIAAFRTYYRGVAGLTDNLEIHFLDTLMPGYLWIFPGSDGTANVGAGMLESQLAPGDGTARRNPKRLAYEAIASHPRLRPRFRDAQEIDGSFRGWQLPCGSERRKLSGDGWMLVGDAASLVDPLTGEGIANAMVSGRIAAKHAADALADSAVPELDGYDAEVWATLGPGLDTAYRMQKLLTHPVSGPMITLLMRWAASSPPVQRAIVGLVQGEVQSMMASWGSFKARASRKPSVGVASR